MAVAAEVHVFVLMARSAQPRWRPRRVARPEMAGAAGGAFMRPFERVLCLGFVIEAPEPPSVGVVAALTGRAEALLVNIVSAMAADARGLRPPEAAAEVALLARGQRMEAEQREAGDIVIEKHVDRPSAFVVATVACGTQLPRVCVLSGMAGRAARIWAFLRTDSPVAGFTPQLCMFAVQLEASITVMPKGFVRP